MGFDDAGEPVLRVYNKRQDKWTSLNITAQAALSDASGNVLTLEQFKRLLMLYGPYTSGNYAIATITVTTDGTMTVDALQINTGSI